MPHSSWKGQIAFGLVSIPIRLINIEDTKNAISFKQLNRKTGNKIQYRRFDIETGKEVAWEDIIRGYEYAKDTILPVAEDELLKVAGENAHVIAIEEFIDQKHINFINIDKTYYLVPDKKAQKPYVILRDALEASNKVGIAKVIITTKEYLCAVTPYENALVLHILHYMDDVKALSDIVLPSDDIKKYKISKAEINIAIKLIQSMSKKWNPKKYKDDYKEAVEKWVHNKLKKRPLKQMPSRTQSVKTNPKLVSFVDLLTKSLSNSTKIKKTSKKSKKTIPNNKSKQQRKTVHHH